MHVAIVGNYPTTPDKIRGGVEAVVLYLSQALQHYPDMKIDVVTVDPGGTRLRREQHGDVTVHYLPASRKPGRLSVSENVRRMSDTLVELRPDLVHAHGTGDFAQASLRSGLPWLVTLHGIRHLEASLLTGLINRYRGWFIKRDEFQIVRQARHMISISPFVHETFTRQIRGQVYTIENPIAESFFNLDSCSKPFQLLYAGRLIPRKDILTLLAAFARLRQHIPHATLRLAGGNRGPGDYAAKISRFVAEHDLDRSVTFLGELNDPTLQKEFARCDVLVLSSILETAPMVVMQAMAARLPVVSTDAGGVRYLVEHERSGCVVPVGDSEALGEALLNVVTNRDKRESMGRRARELAERRFRAAVVAEQTREVYRTIARTFS